MIGRHTISLRLLLRLLPVLLSAALLPWLLQRWLHGPALWLACTPVLLLLAAWAVHSTLAPLRSLLRALSGVTASYRDGEYNFGLHWPAEDELGQLVKAHAELGHVLREQRQHLAQRELLLDTMVQNTPVAMLLTAGGGDGVPRVVFANLAARKLLHGGGRLEGEQMPALLARMPAELCQAIERGGDSLFVLAAADDGGDPTAEQQQCHLARRQFQLNGRRHELLLIRLLTHELRRQEVLTWKKVIRVISHELNNSLAPIASLAHSGAELLRRGRHEQLPQVLAVIEERARHLEQFIRGYARFAKLPAPQLQTIHWADYLAGLQQQIAFHCEWPAAGLSSRGDAAQLSQALLNLLKNAHESVVGKPAEVELKVSGLAGWIRIEIRDNGSGMNEAVLHNALLPFYSTKRNGSGLGLALVREIIEAHDGRIALANRAGGGLCVTLMLPAG